MKLRRRLRLPAESLQPGRVSQCIGRQQLQRDVPPKRFLHRLIDHAHAATADLSQDAELADAIGVSVRGRNEVAGAVAGDGLELLHLDEGREQLADLVGTLWQAIRVLGQGRPFAGPEAGDELLGQALERIAVGRRIGHRTASGGAGMSIPARSRRLSTGSMSFERDVSATMTAGRDGQRRRRWTS
ncbi:MAG: hypothetical protein U0746_04450 [Gemmataceae bacterium]